MRVCLYLSRIKVEQTITMLKLFISLLFRVRCPVSGLLPPNNSPIHCENLQYRAFVVRFFSVRCSVFGLSPKITAPYFAKTFAIARGWWSAKKIELLFLAHKKTAAIFTGSPAGLICFCFLPGVKLFSDMTNRLCCVARSAAFLQRAAIF